MKGSVKILGIAGSLRRGSYNRAVLAAAAKMAPASMCLETFEDLARYHRSTRTMKTTRRGW